MNEKIITISKFLSLILRHQPQKIGLDLDKNGWANVDELLQKCSHTKHFFTLEELEIVVETNNKKRFSFNEDKTKIRANQGHSLEVDVQLKRKTPPEFLYHGTAERFVKEIRKGGIQKMKRQHVHLSDNKDTASQVGSRHGKPVVLTIRSGEMAKSGIPFFLSENGVWLTDFVDKKWIE
jgi:putative RNA 2'-phosphotransferase